MTISNNDNHGSKHVEKTKKYNWPVYMEKPPKQNKKPLILLDSFLKVTIPVG